MSLTVSKLNYATPISSVVDFGSEQGAAQDKKYFTLSDNVLDGSYYPVSGDAGLWSAASSDANGMLSEPFIIHNIGDYNVHSILVRGSQYVYPVDFTIELLDGDTVIHSIDVVGNTLVEYIEYLPSMLVVTSYRVSITRISRANSAARILNVYNAGYIKRQLDVPLAMSERTVSFSGDLITVITKDTLSVGTLARRSALTNRIDPTHDALMLNGTARSLLTNVHSRMKDPSRRIYGKVYVTYTDPMLDSSSTYTASSTSNGSGPSQIADGRNSTNPAYFTLYENDLSGKYVPIGAGEHTGWVSGQLSGPGGVFSDPAPYIRFDFVERPVTDLSIVFDTSRNALAKDFTVEYYLANGSALKKTFVNNNLETVVIHETIVGVIAIRITVTRIAREGYPVCILEVPVMSTMLYTGYQDTSDLISIDLLEELTYDDEVEALGGISANEISIAFDNSKRSFFFNNPNSVVANYLKRNRKIVPWLGVEVIPGEIEWYTLGTFWSYSWNIPVEGLVAKVTGFDTIGLLNTTSFAKHHVLQNNSLGQLIEYVLNDAKKQLSFIEYNIDPTLYEVRIPYAWFEAKSHTAALRRISSCYPMHIYCDRDGVICAAPQRLHLDNHYDVWSDSTNVISKDYSSLHTTIPNVINVTVHSPSVVMEENLAADSLQFNVSTVPTRTLNFNKPYVSDLSVIVDCDATVSYTYEAYSWGIEFSFTGTGIVRSIECSGRAVDLGHSATITRQDASSVMLNGAVTRDIESDFIQTSDLAATLINRLFELSIYDRYDAQVDYRGDIALSINEPILLLNGIAPTDKYNIKRHELFWDGSLHGSAYLNT